MGEYVVKQGRKLQIGYTTGTCATAAAKAAAHALFVNKFPESISITVPAGKTFNIEVLNGEIEEKPEGRCVRCGVRKDSGDDPDVTHGMLIYASVRKIESVKEREENWVELVGGQGIGQVTKTGLACQVGGPAINPVPRKMIEEAVLEEMRNAGYLGGIQVEISAPWGEEIAKKTFNARLGILGGISILGTSGVVEPMSEDALIETIKIEMNQQDRGDVLFASPGNYGVDFSKNEYGIDMEKSVKYSNYLGEFIDHAIYCGFKRILLISHMGKMIKVAAGVMNTHSKIADARNEIMVAHSALCGVEQPVLEKLMEAVTTDEMHEILATTGKKDRVYESIRDRIQFQLDYRSRGEVEIAFVAFSNQHGLVMESKDAQEFVGLIEK